MLVYLERIAVNAGLTTIFVLSTRCVGLASLKMPPLILINT